LLWGHWHGQKRKNQNAKLVANKQQLQQQKQVQLTTKMLAAKLQSRSTLPRSSTPNPTPKTSRSTEPLAVVAAAVVTLATQQQHQQQHKQFVVAAQRKTTHPKQFFISITNRPLSAIKNVFLSSTTVTFRSLLYLKLPNFFKPLRIYLFH